MKKNKTHNLFNLKSANNASRFTALAIILTLLVPIFLFQPDARRASASALPVAPAVAAPAPLAFVVGSGESVLADIGTSAIGLAVSAVDMVSKLFGKEKIPAGLEQPGAELKRSEYVTAESNSSAFFMPPQGAVRFDFDHDGKADLGRWQASNSEWKVKNSGSGTFSTTTIGSGSSIVAPGDFDGDGYTDPAVFNGGTWTIKKSSNGQTITVAFGASGDKPVVGDYDGDGKSDCAVFRPSTNTWWILQSTTGTYTSTAFGAAGDITIPGNFDGDDKTDIAVFRPSTGDWHVLKSSSGYSAFHWGIAADIPVSGDFDGDGKTDFAVYRGSTGTWYISKSETGNISYIAQSWGNYGDQPVPADYDGDGKDDIAVWRPTTGIWYIIKSEYGQFDYPGLGVAGDVAITSAYLKQIGGYIYSSDFAKARLSPKNATGGTNLYSRNFGWSSGLVGLPGRAGLDMGFGISYNSLIWTKDSVNNTVVFNADNSNLTPGFNFGFPTIEPAYFDAQTGKFAYLMVSPSGSRTEFRQTAASGVYETADSSYAQLKINEGTVNSSADSVSLTLTTTDGTQRLYEWKGGSYKCQKITDRNGNKISINHDSTGKLLTVTDTLGRVVTVNYNAEGYPSSITQDWKDQNGTGSTVTRTYATFTYATQTISTNFANLTVIGPGDGYAIKVLQKVTFPTETTGAGPSTVFDYNTWGQVMKISNFAADNHLLNYTKVDLPLTASDPQPDCPRFGETKTWIENFNQGSSGIAQETVVENKTFENSSYTLPDGHSGSATKIEVKMPNHPNGLITNTFVGGSGWMEGLTIATEDFANGSSGSERKRWTWTGWTQDNVSLGYILNPRTVESKVGDTTNIKRSTTEYFPLSASYPTSLVMNVKIYDGDQPTVLKQVDYQYLTDSAYLTRRIIGLPSSVIQRGLDQQTNLFGPVTHVTYRYDEGDFSNSALNQNPSSPTQHESSFGPALTVGRGNMTSMTRHDVTGLTPSVTSSVKYNTTGAVVSQTDPVGRTVKIAYDDSFNDTPANRNTFAYPTKVIDPADNFSEVKYRFDTGATVWAKSPAPAGNSTGKETTRWYDHVGRIEKETLVNTGAYTRYAYPANTIQSSVYTTIVDTNNSNTADTADEVYSESWSDGAGRVRRSRTEHPGSTGGWSGTLAEYDVLGRMKRSTAPTEISVPDPINPDTWSPVGDDYRGVDGNQKSIWLWQQQEFDWKSRVVRTIPFGSTGDDGKDRVFSYDGCGCAGGQVLTEKGELVQLDTNSNQSSRRTKRTYQDVLGRTYKIESLNWDGTSVYATTLMTFDGGDKVVRMVQQDNSQSPVVEQVTTQSYDGHGRLSQQHLPQQDPNAHITFLYNSDDSLSSKTDGRGISTQYQYNLTRQVASYSFQDGTTTSMGATFAYDAVGNRTLMTDRLGTVNYEYDSSSRLSSEHRHFSDFLPNAPNGFRLSYEYDLSGSLKKITDPYGQEVNYSKDRTGNIKQVTGSAWAQNTNYVHEIKYRAFGAAKSMAFGDNRVQSYTFDNQLNVNSFVVNKNGLVAFSNSYEYYNDGRLKFSGNSGNPSELFNRSYTYDHVGRLTKAQTGTEASGTSQPDLTQLPYRLGYEYDAFGNILSLGGTSWSGLVMNVGSFTNNRMSFYNYDADGRMTGRSTDQWGNFNTYIYDHSGELSQHNEGRNIPWGQTGVPWTRQSHQYRDGDGQLIKQFNYYRVGPTAVLTNKTFYYIRSSVLGGKLITEADKLGTKVRTYVFAGDETVAIQKGLDDAGTWNPSVSWSFADPTSTSVRAYDSNGGTIESDSAELDTMGNNVGLQAPVEETPGDHYQEGPYWSYGSPTSCLLDGIETPCNTVQSMLSRGYAAVCPYNHCGPVKTSNGVVWGSDVASGRLDSTQNSGRMKGIFTHDYFKGKFGEKRGFAADGGDNCTVKDANGNDVPGTLDREGICRINIGSSRVDIDISSTKPKETGFRMVSQGNSYGNWLDLQPILPFEEPLPYPIKPTTPPVSPGAPPSSPTPPPVGCDDGGSTADFNVSAAMGIGFQGGIQFNDRFISPYFGVQFGVGSSGSVTASNSPPPADGTYINGNATALGSVGYSVPMPAGADQPIIDWKNGSFSYGIGAPVGAGGGIYRAKRYRWRCNIYR